jgi:hypothetical protein
MIQIKKLYVLFFFFVICNLALFGQEDNLMKTELENARFPFGEPLHKVEQTDRTPKTVFVLGVYASAVHAQWFNPKGTRICQALAVASEPEIFWRGDDNEAETIIARIQIPKEAGYLKPAQGHYNGPSGKVLDALFLAPLGFTRNDAWLCDLVPYSQCNTGQQKAIAKNYAPLASQFNLPVASIPVRKSKVTIDDARRNEILKELLDSKAENIVLLGDIPIEQFLYHVSDCKIKKLAGFGKTTYGEKQNIQINGKQYVVYPLVHPRQAGSLGKHTPVWEQLHKDWVNKNMQPK